MWLHWMLQGHVGLVLEGGVVEVEVSAFLVDRQEIDRTLEGLCPAQLLLMLGRPSVCMQ